MTVTTNKAITTSYHVTMPHHTKSLKASVKQSLDTYFRQLDGVPPQDFYTLLMAQVEPPVLEKVMQYVSGNQSKAAQLLGISRGTLRKKLKHYGLLDD
jgi:Fis family transcriptional regulator, factor for inversion stimulation protein